MTSLAVQLVDDEVKLDQDPFVAPHEVPAHVDLVECTAEVVEAADVVVVLTDHDAVDWPLLNRHGADVLDTRNRLTAPGVDRL